MTTAAAIPNDELDLHVDEQIKQCLDLQAPQSFFLFAGAGSGKTRSLVNALDHVRHTVGKKLRRHGRKVAVITYTKAARDEIIRRTQFTNSQPVGHGHQMNWAASPNELGTSAKHLGSHCFLCRVT